MLDNKIILIIILVITISFTIKHIINNTIKCHCYITKGYHVSDYIILRSIFPNDNDKGGFAWHLHHAQCLFKLCDITNKRPIIYYKNDYYFEIEYGNNWWDYYFIPVECKYLTERLIDFGNKNGYQEINSLPLLDTNNPYLYTNNTFQNILRNIDIDFAYYYQKIKLNNKMKTKVDLFVKKHFNNYYMIGIHYRGTDKFAGYQDSEDMKESFHLDYNITIKTVEQFITKNYLTNTKIFVCSDEQPFIDKCYEKFNNIISYNSIRSNTNTSNLKLDSYHCDESEKSKIDPTCNKLEKLQYDSIHRGMKNVSPYRKGQDAIMDIWLLSKCNIMFRSQGGNFSSQPVRINPRLILYNIT